MGKFVLVIAVFLLCTVLVSGEQNCPEGLLSEEDACIDDSVKSVATKHKDSRSFKNLPCDELPSDPHFSTQWYLHNTGQFGGTPGVDIQALDAWCLEKGSDEVVIAVISTGVDYVHEDFGGCPGENCKLLEGYDAVEGTNNIFDSDNKGTSLAGIIGAESHEYTEPSHPTLLTSKIRIHITEANEDYGVKIVNLNEVEVFSTVSGGVNLAPDAQVSASHQGEQGHGVDYINDENHFTFWLVTQFEEETVVLEWPMDIEFNRITIVGFGGLQPVDYTISYWNESHWEELFVVTNNQLSSRTHVYEPYYAPVGTTAVCWECKVLPVRGRISNNEAELEHIISGLAYAQELADIILIDYVTYEDIPQLRDAISVAAQHSLLVAPAGDDQLFRSRAYPAAYEEVIAVGSTNINNKVHSSVNRNAWDDHWIDLAAPGVTIKTPRPHDDRYWYRTGSSYSAAIVAGTLGLLRSHFPSDSFDQLRGRLLATTQSYDEEELVMGSGVVNAFEALNQDPRVFVSLRRIIVEEGSVVPGVTSHMRVQLKNEWESVSGLSAELITNNPKVNIVKSTHHYGDFQGQEIKDGDFIIRYNSDDLEPLRFTLQLSAQGFEQSVPVVVYPSLPVLDAWPVSRSTGPVRQLSVGQFTPDHYTEILALEARSTGASVHVFDMNADYVSGWPVHDDRISHSVAPLVFDVDKDGLSETFFMSSDRQQIISYDASGQERWVFASDWYISGMVVSDILRNGFGEIIILEVDDYYYDRYNVTVLSHQGFRLFSYELFGYYPRGESLSVADIDGDGFKEIMLYSDGRVHVVRLNGDILDMYYDYCDSCYNSNILALADTNNNGHKEIAISTGSHHGLFSSSGSLLFDVYSGVWESYQHITLIGNLDSDSQQELVFVTSGYFPSDPEYYDFFSDTMIRPYKQDGSLLDDCWSDLRGIPQFYAVVLADTDNDKKNEIVIHTGTELRAYSADCSYEVLRLEPSRNTKMIVTDVNKNGRTNIILADEEIIIYELSSTATHHSWPMHKNNPFQTNNRDECAGTVLIGDFNVDHRVGADDYNLFALCYDSQEAQCDLNQDGFVDEQDVALFSEQLGMTNDCLIGVTYSLRDLVCQDVCVRNSDHFGLCHCQSSQEIKIRSEVNR